MLEECDKASQDFAPDPVHDLRVAIRRCRSMADGFLSVDPDPAWKEMKKLGKPLFSSLGELRDVQVMSEWVTSLSEDRRSGSPHCCSHSLAPQRERTKGRRARGACSFDRKRWTALNAKLAKRTEEVPLEGLVFQHLALERWMEAHELHRQALRNRTQVGYHQLRIGIKRFRYTVENFLPQRHEKWAADLRDLQDALGEVHDFDVLRAMIRAHSEISAEERERWNKRIAEERQKRLDLYRAKMLGKNSLWHVWRAELPSWAIAGESGAGEVADLGFVSRSRSSALGTGQADRAAALRCALARRRSLHASLSTAAFSKLRPSCMRWDEARERTDI